MAEYSLRLPDGRTVKKSLGEGLSDAEIQAAFLPTYKSAGFSQPGAVIKAYHPSLGERFQQGLEPILGKHIAERAFGFLNDLTPVGNMTMAADAGTDIRNGHPFRGLGLGALAVLPGAVGKGMFGRAFADRMRRASDLGFNIDAYHGTSAGDIGDAFDPSKVRDNAQYGGNFYFSPTPEYANKHVDKWGGDAPAVYPVRLRIQKPFKMDEPISADDAAAALDALGQRDRAKTIRESGQGYRSGSEFFYWGMGQQTHVADKANALRAAGFDGVIGDPAQEITGKPGRPHIMVFEPNQVRSRFANFDPAKAGSSRLLD